MQDVTDMNFMRTVSGFGPPDVFVTEYLRVHQYTILEDRILEPLLDESLGAPVCFQIIGEDAGYIARTIEMAKAHPRIKYLDLNLGCPAPKVYKKNVGGALLKDPKKIAEILSVMRRNWDGVLSAKMRLGFDDASSFDTLIKAVRDSGADFITLHARTVKQLYRPSADHSFTRRAVELAGTTPLVANGDITSVASAKKILDETSCAGLMVGRSAMRNPWIFRQLREALAEGKGDAEIFRPTRADARAYIDAIQANSLKYSPKVKNLPGRLKKFINFIATSVDPEGAFLLEMRAAPDIDSLLKICDKHLVNNGNAEKKLADEPFAELCARPNHE